MNVAFYRIYPVERHIHTLSSTLDPRGRRPRYRSASSPTWRPYLAGGRP
jgi:hypothetical protein